MGNFASGMVNFGGLAKATPWPFLLVERSGGILFANTHFHRLLGSEKLEQNTRIQDLFQPVGGTLADMDKLLLDTCCGSAWHGKWETLQENPAGHGVYELVLEADAENPDHLWVILLENPVINNQMVLSTRSELKLLQILMDHTLDYVYFTDISGRFIITNRIFQRTLDIPYPGYEIGRKMSEFTQSETARWIERTNRQVLKTMQPLINDQGLFTLKNGEGHWLQTNKMPVFDHARHCIGLVSVSRDITERKENEKRIHDALQRAEQANHAKTHFLANMSHEIRTPINGIVGMTELCLETRLSDEQKSYLDTILSCSDTLLTLVSDILDFSKIEAGQLQLEEIQFDLAATIEETVDQFVSLTRDKGLELLLNLDPCLPARVTGDPTRFKQILANLLSNAVKFTEQGEIEVNASVESLRGNRAQVGVMVRDTGIGIPESRQGQIFESFMQGDISTTRRFGGTGLGLSISRQLSELMHGNLTVQSTPGKGSAFTLSLQFEVVDQSTTDPSRMLETLSGMPVLIVDDNATNREILRNLCRRWGFQPQVAPAGMEGLQALEESRDIEKPISLLLLDQQMPGLSGLDLAALVLNRPSLKDTRIIILSSSLNQDEVERGKKLGVKRLLSKPIKQSVLLNVIMDVFNVQTPPGELATTPEHGEDDITQKPEVEQASLPPLKILLAEDNPVNQQVSMQRLRRMGHEVTLVENGENAVEAFKTVNFDLIIMDVQMPVMDGLEATRQIRSIEKDSGRDRRTPIVAMTAHALKGDKSKCLEAGMDDYITKPFRSDKLQRVLKRTLDQNKELELKAWDDSTAFDLKAVLASLDQEGLEDFELAAEIFNQNERENLTKLEQAIKTSAWEQIGQAAHNIKGEAGLLQAGLLYHLCERLEQSAREQNAQPQHELVAKIRVELESIARQTQAFMRG